MAVLKSELKEIKHERDKIKRELASAKPESKELTRAFERLVEELSLNSKSRDLVKGVLRLQGYSETEADLIISGRKGKK